MTNRLVEIEREALQLKNSGRMAEAAELFSLIIENQPDWEHGTGFLDLAQCCEDLGRFEEAEKFDRAALEYGPTSDLFLGGYASFLYLHGRPEDAFDTHVRLLQVYRCENSQEDVDSCMVALNALGERLGWSSHMIAERIEKATKGTP